MDLTSFPKPWTMTRVSVRMLPVHTTGRIGERPNLVVMTNTRANRILWTEDNSDSEVIASGVETTKAGITSEVKARKEAILSAGSLRSPALLELSGVGNKE